MYKGAMAIFFVMAALVLLVGVFGKMGISSDEEGIDGISTVAPAQVSEEMHINCNTEGYFTRTEVFTGAVKTVELGGFVIAEPAGYGAHREKWVGDTQVVFDECTKFTAKDAGSTTGRSEISPETVSLLFRRISASTIKREIEGGFELYAWRVSIQGYPFQGVYSGETKIIGTGEDADGLYITLEAKLESLIRFLEDATFWIEDPEGKIVPFNEPLKDEMIAKITMVWWSAEPWWHVAEVRDIQIE